MSREALTYFGYLFVRKNDTFGDPEDELCNLQVCVDSVGI